MNYKILLFVLLALVFKCCNNLNKQEQQTEHEEPVIQITAYNGDFELFAETIHAILQLYAHY